MSPPPTTDSTSPSLTTPPSTASVDTTSKGVVDADFEAHVNDDTYIARDRDEFLSLAWARSRPKALKVLHIVETYNLQSNRGDDSSVDVYGCLPVVTRHITCGRPVRLLLPGFRYQGLGWRDEVLGLVPSRGVKLALGRLQRLCDEIRSVYDAGAEVHVCLDGVVYNDLMGVSDGAVWEYGEALGELAKRDEYHSLRFIQLWDLLDQDSTRWTKEYYLEHAASIRSELVCQYRDAQLEGNEEPRCEQDTGNVADDLVSQPPLTGPASEEKRLESPRTAKAMVERRKAYMLAVEDKGYDHVRLRFEDVGRSQISAVV